MNVKNLLRKISVIGAFGVACLSIPAVVKAGYATAVIGDSTASLDGYINGVDSSWFLPVQINYNAFLYGDEWTICTCFPKELNNCWVQAGTDRKKLSKVYLNDYRRSVNETKVDMGYKGDKAELVMHMDSYSKTISTYLD